MTQITCDYYKVELNTNFEWSLQPKKKKKMFTEKKHNFETNRHLFHLLS